MALNELKLVLSVDGAGKVTGNLKDVEGAVDSLGKKTASATNNMNKVWQSAEEQINTLRKTSSVVTDRLASDFERLKIKSDYSLQQQKASAVTAYDAIKNSGVASAKEIDRAHSALKTTLADLDREMKNTGKSAGMMAEAWKVFSAAAIGVALGAVVKESIQAALQMGRLNKLFAAAAGDANLAGRELEYIRGVSNRLGLDLVSTADSYGKFLANIRGTTLEGEKGRKVFEAVSGAASALGLTTETTNRAFTALNQMLAKGTVSSEELRQQWSEAIPGGFKMAADAMGMTTGELGKALEQGKIMAEDLLPKLADQLEKTYGKAALEGANSAQAAINRMNNAMLESKATLGSALMPAFTDLMTTVITPLVKMIGDLVRALQHGAATVAFFVNQTADGFKALLSGKVFTDKGYKESMNDAIENEKIYKSAIDKIWAQPGAGAYITAEKLRQAGNKSPEPLTDGKADKEAAKALKLAEQYEKDYLADMEKWRKAQEQLADTYDKAAIAAVEQRRDRELAILKNQYDQGLLSQADYLDKQYQQQVAASDKSLEQLESAALRNDHAYYAALKAEPAKPTDGNPVAVEAYNKAILLTVKLLQESEAAWAKVDAAAAKSSTAAIVNEGAKAAIQRENAKAALGFEAQLLQAAGETYAATLKQIEADKLSRKPVDEKTDALRNQLDALKALKAQQDDINALRAITNKTEDINISMMNDPYEQQRASMEAAYKREKELIEQKIKLLQASKGQELSAIDYITKAGIESAHAINKVKFFNDPVMLEKSNKARLDAEKSYADATTPLRVAAQEQTNTLILALTDQMHALTAKKDKNLADILQNQSLDSWEAALSIAKKAVPQLAMFDKLIAATHKDFVVKRMATDEELAAGSEKMVKNETSSNLNMYGAYAGAVGGLFEGMAQAQDQSSRSGFESAKAYNIAAAVMNTASGIMNAFATSGNIYSGAAMAALVAAAGAIQIATIASTSFGGGASAPSAPSGTVATGGSSGSGTAMTGMSAAVGNPYMSLRDQQTGEQLDRIAESMGNAALAMGKISESLFDLTDYLETGFGQALIENVPGVAQTNNKQAGMFSSSVQPLIGGLTPIDPGFAILNLVSNMFASENKVLENGVAIGLEKGITAVANGWLSREVGNRWSGSERRNETFDIDPAYTQALQNAFNLITSAAREQVVAIGVWGKDSGSMFDALAQGVSVASVQLDRTAEDFDEKLTAVISNIGNSIVEATFPDIAQYALPGGYETAIEILERLAVSITDVNASFAMIGKTVLESSPAMANAAYKLTELMGGSAAFSEAIDTYFTSMFTDFEQEAAKTAEAKRKVNSAFTEMDSLLPKRYESILDHFDAMTNTAYMSVVESASKMPQTREEFRSLVNSLDVTSESGAALFASLMSVSEAFGVMMDDLDAIAAKAKEIQQATQDLDVRYLKATGQDDAAAAMERQLSAQREIEQAYADDMGQPYIDRLREVLALEEKAATTSVQDMTSILAQRKGLQDQLDVLNGVRTQRDIDLAKITDDVSASLQQQIWAAQDLKTATDAAAAAEKQLADQRRGYQGQYDVLAGVRSQRDIDLSKIEDPWSRAMQARIYGLQDEQAALNANTAALQSAVDASNTALETAKSNLQAAFDAEKERLTAAYDLELKRLNSNLDAATETVSRLTSYVDKLKSAREAMSLDDAAYQQSQYAGAQAQLAAALVQARGGDLSGIETMDESLSILTNQGADAYANSTDYQRDFWRTSNSISELENLAGNQLTDAQRANDLAQQQIDTLTANHDAHMLALDNQLNALLGLNVAAMSIADAIAGLTAAQASYAAASAALPVTPTATATPTKVTYSNLDILKYVNDAIARLGSGTDAMAYDVYTAAAKYGVSSSQLSAATEGRLGWTQDVINQWVDSKGLPRFADGGITSGLSIAGEAGPEAIIPLPDGRSVPVQMTGSADNKEVVDELRALRQEVAQLRAQTGQVANNTRKVADYAEKDDVIGIPATRTA